MLHPPANNTKVLVHMVLLMGKMIDQSKPKAIHAIPARNNLNTFCLDEPDSDLIKVPVNMPIIAEQIAGIVLKIPSGS